MTPLDLAELALRDAKSAKIRAEDYDLILENGRCPHYWGHFDWVSFAIGAAVAGILLAIAMFVAFHPG